MDFVLRTTLRRRRSARNRKDRYRQDLQKVGDRGLEPVTPNLSKYFESPAKTPYFPQLCAILALQNALARLRVFSHDFASFLTASASMTRLRKLKYPIAESHSMKLRFRLPLDAVLDSTLERPAAKGTGDAHAILSSGNREMSREL